MLQHQRNQRLKGQGRVGPRKEERVCRPPQEFNRCPTHFRKGPRGASSFLPYRSAWKALCARSVAFLFEPSRVLGTNAATPLPRSGLAQAAALALTRSSTKRSQPPPRLGRSPETLRAFFGFPGQPHALIAGPRPFEEAGRRVTLPVGTSPYPQGAPLLPPAPTRVATPGCCWAVGCAPKGTPAPSEGPSPAGSADPARGGKTCEAPGRGGVSTLVSWAAREPLLAAAGQGCPRGGGGGGGGCCATEAGSLPAEEARRARRHPPHSRGWPGRAAAAAALPGGAGRAAGSCGRRRRRASGTGCRLSKIKAEAGLQQPLRLETQEEGGRGG